MKRWAGLKPLAMKMTVSSATPLLPRIVAGLVVGVLALIILGSATPQTRPIVLAVLALAVLVVIELWRRRRWERSVTTHMQQLDEDNRRMMRDLARQRQDNGQLREVLSATGATLNQQNRAQRNNADLTTEQRMLRTIAAELSRLSVPVETVEDNDVLAGVSELELAMIEHHATSTDGASALSAVHVVQLVKSAVEQDRIDLFTQPIVTLPQRKTRFVEAFARIRIRAGVHMPAERYIEVAREQNLLPAIDNLLLLQSLQALRTADDDSGVAYFCNITSLTLHDPKFMTDLVEFIAEHRTLAQRLIFELGQHDLATMSHDVIPVLSGLVRLGCRFSLDQVRDLNLDIETLIERRIRFIKLDAAMLIAALQKPGGAARVQKLKNDLDLEGIDMIAERVESERQLVELLDVGIDYGQGYLFARPLEYGQEDVPA